MKFFSSAAYPVADVAPLHQRRSQRRRIEREGSSSFSVYCDAILIAALKIALLCRVGGWRRQPRKKSNISAFAAGAARLINI